jgi:hypothetical protein
LPVDEHVARAQTCVEQKQTVPLLLLSEPTLRASIVISLQFWPKEFKVKKLALVSLAFALLMSLTALAQNASKKDNPKQDNTKSTSHTETVTGCLQKGDEAGEFSLTSEDGKTWGLRSSSVKLDQHVGHKVTVSGPVTREWKAEEKKEGQLENASGKEEYGELRVTSLKMVSATCSRESPCQPFNSRLFQIFSFAVRTKSHRNRPALIAVL